LIPDQLHEIGIDLGFGYRSSEKWTFLGWASPGVFSDFEDLSSEDFGITSVFAAQWTPSDAFNLQFGFRVASPGQYPILPIAGLTWKFAPDWEMALTAPSPQISWSPSESLKLLVGGSFRGSSYRVAEDFGRKAGRPDLDGTITSFREIRTFAGLEWQLKGGLRVRIEGGYMVDREFDFYDDDLKFNVENAPYASLEARYSF
jgi:hypothetical protein